MIYEYEHFSKKEIKLLDSIMTRIIDHLELPSNVYITFERSKDPTGGCIELEDNEFLIEIPKKVTDAEFMAFVAHEMKHVEQYSSGRLKQGELWMGICYKDTPYHEKPWEIEAYQFESVVYEKRF